jgi:hypothetical protein
MNISEFCLEFGIDRSLVTLINRPVGSFLIKGFPKLIEKTISCTTVPIKDITTEFLIEAKSYLKQIIIYPLSADELLWYNKTCIRIFIKEPINFVLLKFEEFYEEES